MAKYMLSLKGSIDSIGSFATKNKIVYKGDLKAKAPQDFADTIKAIAESTFERHVAYGQNQMHDQFHSVCNKVKKLKSVSELLGNPELLQELSMVFRGRYGEAAKFALENPVLAVNELFPIVSVYEEILGQDESEEHQLQDNQKITSDNGNSGYKVLISGWFSSMLPSFLSGENAKKEDVVTDEVNPEVFMDEDNHGANDKVHEYTSGDIDKHFQNQVDMVTGHAKHYCYNYAKLNTIILDFCDFNFQMETPFDNEIAKLSLHEFASMTQQLVQAPQGTGNLIGDGSTLLLGASDDSEQKQIAEGSE